MNLFTTTPKTDSEKLKQIKAWVYQSLEIDSETAISINQLQCREPNCSPIETVIAIMTTPPQQYKIHKPASEITEADLANIKEKNSCN